MMELQVLYYSGKRVNIIIDAGEYSEFVRAAKLRGVFLSTRGEQMNFANVLSYSQV